MMGKILGMVGGLSPYSTLIYYKEINELYKNQTGTYPEIILYSVNVDKVCKYMSEKDYKQAESYLGNALKALENSGASIGLIAANTPHILYERFLSLLNRMKLVSILESTYNAIQEKGLETVGILATRPTIESRLYHNYLEKRGIKIIEPTEFEQNKLDEIINHLVSGKISDTFALTLSSIGNGLLARGAKGILLACTELSLVFNRIKSRVPIIDSTREHIKAAVNELLKET
jgi:aspartate racemase